MGVVYWNPAPLDAAIAKGFEASLVEVAADASATSGSPKATATVHQTGPTSAELRAAGELGPIFEEGARPHEIEGSRGYLYLGGGKFVSGVVEHPGSPRKPYLGEAAQRWMHGGCQGAMRESCAASGFSGI
jgi:hypothetical protein